jgi:RNA polymerase sigma factor (sigma-70 family)
MMLAVMPAPALVAAADRSDFEAAVNSDARRLYGVALSILRDPGEAEDAVQEAMVKAWRSWHTLRESDRRSPWLTRICVNHCISRRRRRRLLVFSYDDHPSEPADPRAEQALDPADPDLDRACGRLTPPQRAVIALHYHHGYTLDECAGLMGCRPGTVRSHLNRALTTLRAELGHV